MREGGVTQPLLKTKAEQRLEQLSALRRPLTDEESNELSRVMHAVYERDRRMRHEAQHRKEELKLLAKLQEEARQPERYPRR